MTTTAVVANFLLLLGLGFFFGLAFEEFNTQGGQARPGGVRSFPLLALAGALLYRLDSDRLLPLTAGLLVLGAWLTCYYWQHIAELDPEGKPNVGLMVPICNVLAYLLGPGALADPAWVAIGVTVVAVLLLTARERLHGLAQRIELAEIVTAGKFLILTGLVLPFLPSERLTALTEVTPHQMWLAVLAVCTVSYASYLLQRYLGPREGGLWMSVLGGLYSSTATTVMLARRMRAVPAFHRQAQTGIILATAVMYLRLLIIVALFDSSLAATLALPLITLALLGLGFAALWYWLTLRAGDFPSTVETPANPLELTAAFVFAIVFVVISIASDWVRSKFGEAGLYGLAALVGASDIDPFVLSIASGGAVPLSFAVPAILIAASSNNILKAIYAAGFAGIRAALAPGGALLLLSMAGGGIAWWMAV
jgi:uncharacterized membrane protein (DUF4010 family)